MFDRIDPQQLSLNILLDARVVLVMWDTDRTQDEPKMVGIVKDPKHWRDAYVEMCKCVPDGKHAKILVWELRGDADELAVSEDIIGGL